MASDARVGPPRTIDAIDAADALLCALAVQRGPGLVLEPGDKGWRLTLPDVAGVETALALPAPLATAVALRLALLGSVDPWAGDEERLGRVDVTVGTLQCSFLLAFRPLEAGPRVELTRLVGQGESTATVDALALDRRQFGPYRLEREVGRGAMGIVYRAIHMPTGTAVAIKLLAPAIAADAGMASRFAREGRAAAQVGDPGVVGVTDFGSLADGRSYLVMEFVETPTLEARLGLRAALPVADAVRIAVRIAAVLEVAHVRGVIHRDLKPSNIFLAEDGAVKIADFGAAHVADWVRGAASGEESVVLGTPAYMAPEQAQAQPVDERADLYSLGCILYRMLSGAPPFRGGGGLDVLMRQIHEPPAPPSSPFGPVPDVLTACVLRALAKRPDERFRGASDMRQALERVLTQVGPSVRRRP